MYYLKSIKETGIIKEPFEIFGKRELIFKQALLSEKSIPVWKISAMFINAK